MSRKSTVRSLLLGFAFTVVAACGTCGPSARVPTTDSTTVSASKPPAAATDTKEDLPGLKELDEADRKQAEKQKRCPVTDELLGTADMGKPYKMTYKDRTFFLCCEGCKEAIKKDPDKYFKKLDELLGK